MISGAVFLLLRRFYPLSGRLPVRSCWSHVLFVLQPHQIPRQVPFVLRFNQSFDLDRDVSQIVFGHYVLKLPGHLVVVLVHKFCGCILGPEPCLGVIEGQSEVLSATGTNATSQSAVPQTNPSSQGDFCSQICRGSRSSW